MGPHFIGEELELIVIGPAVQLGGFAKILPGNFLEEDNVRVELTQSLFNFIKNELSIQRRVPFVNVVTQNANFHIQYLNITARRAKSQCQCGDFVQPESWISRLWLSSIFHC